MLKTKKYGNDVYSYLRRQTIGIEELEKINGKTWADAAEKLGISIPSLFIALRHLKKAGFVNEVKIV